MIVGVLAFQGDFSEHIDVLRTLDAETMEVRSLDDLAQVDLLIIPGGESTVIARFLQETGVGKQIVARVRGEHGAKPLSVFGTCAGAIVLAKEATGKNAPDTLSLIDITVDRNAYGTQVDSFEAELRVKGFLKPVNVSFIRAPKITRIGKDVVVLSSYKGMPVLVRQGRVMVATFHSEVRGAQEIHSAFLRMIPENEHKASYLPPKR